MPISRLEAQPQAHWLGIKGTWPTWLSFNSSFSFSIHPMNSGRKGTNQLVLIFYSRLSQLTLLAKTKFKVFSALFRTPATLVQDRVRSSVILRAYAGKNSDMICSKFGNELDGDPFHSQNALHDCNYNRSIWRERENNSTKDSSPGHYLVVSKLFFAAISLAVE